MFLSALAAQSHADGAAESITVTLGQSHSTESTLSEGVQNTTSVCITEGMKSSIEASLGGADFGFSIKSKLETSLELEQSWSSSYNKESSVSTADTWSTQANFNHTFTANDPAGSYRYAMYAKVSDVYFVYITSPDKQRLLYWNTSVCVRANEGRELRFEYSVDGTFDYDHPSAEDLLGFPVDFWKNLGDPSNLPIVQVSYNVPGLGDSSSAKIHKNTDDKHTGNILVGLPIDKLIACGYQTVTVTMEVETRAHGNLDKGNGRKIWLDIDNASVWNQSNINISWTSWTKRTYSATIPITSFNNTSPFRLGFSHESSDNNQNWTTWYFNGATVTFKANK